MYRYSLLITLLLLIFSQLTLALDINEACNELDEQENAAFSKLSTSHIEANKAGQCTGWRSINKYQSISLTKPCNEFLEQRNNILGNLSTSLKEASQAGICLGAIYFACGDTSYSAAAQRIVDSGFDIMDANDIKKVADCYDW